MSKPIQIDTTPIHTAVDLDTAGIPKDFLQPGFHQATDQSVNDFKRFMNEENAEGSNGESNSMESSDLVREQDRNLGYVGKFPANEDLGVSNAPDRAPVRNPEYESKPLGSTSSGDNETVANNPVKEPTTEPGRESGMKPAQGDNAAIDRDPVVDNRTAVGDGSAKEPTLNPGSGGSPTVKKPTTEPGRESGMKPAQGDNAAIDRGAVVDNRTAVGDGTAVSDGSAKEPTLNPGSGGSTVPGQSDTASPLTPAIENALLTENTPETGNNPVGNKHLSTDKAKEALSTEEASVPEPESLLRDVFAGMTNPLSRMFSENMPNTAAPSVEPLSSSTMAELADRLVERILVSQPDANGQEIRLQLAQNSGVNAEMRLLRGTDGSLSISMYAKDPNTFQLLVAAQDSLQTSLGSQEKGMVRVQVLSETEQENNDSNRRSKGYMQYKDEEDL